MIQNKVKDVRNIFIEKYKNQDFIIDKSNQKTIEIINASFVADEPYIFKEPNKEYIEREIKWYLSMSLNVNDFPGGAPKIWHEVASRQGYINSNYGWCIFSQDNFYQLEHVIEELKENPNSRRAIMIYTRPSMWLDYNKNGMSDFMCTNNVQYLIRDNKIHSLVYMRSNDAIFGYRNDFAWQKYVLTILVNQLQIAPGTIYWNVGSLHIYERHFNEIEKFISLG